YDIAQATLREAQDAYERMKKLHDANALPDMQWVAVQEKLKQAQSAAAIARKEMDDANIYSPVSGVVAAKLADVGQTVAPGIPVVEILDVSSLKAKISVPEADLPIMKAGTAATVSAAGRQYSAKLAEKGVAANPLSRNYDIKFLIANPDGNISPGMICSLALEAEPSTQSSPAEIVLPPQAVVLDWDNTPFVWVKKGGKAARLQVETAGLDSRGIIISGGLSASDSIIVEGQQKLSSGLDVVSVN
ncbi:MAG: efflux RND transporter periplasmic adaptor subunit, partial [Lachnospiraceae bacterium]|nr:efflux RND transporter periplasmic adaptor subunit [Lachnospiraceae bacterium]